MTEEVPRFGNRFWWTWLARAGLYQATHHGLTYEMFQGKLSSAWILRFPTDHPVGRGQVVGLADEVRTAKAAAEAAVMVDFAPGGGSRDNRPFLYGAIAEQEADFDVAEAYPRLALCAEPDLRTLTLIRRPIGPVARIRTEFIGDGPDASVSFKATNVMGKPIFHAGLTWDQVCDKLAGYASGRLDGGVPAA